MQIIGSVLGEQRIEVWYFAAAWLTICRPEIENYGFAGQISLATLAFAGISAFSLVKLSIRWGIGFPWAPLLAASGYPTVPRLQVQCSSLHDMMHSFLFRF